MQRAKRHRTIIDAVRLPQGARVADLVRATGVSAMTIRRDLDDLARQGLLRRSHGGATGVPPRGTRLPYALRVGSGVEHKDAIAVRAAALIPDGSSVILDEGTTCAAVARRLAGRDLTVLALSVHVALALGEVPGTRVVTPGGELDADELSWVGHGAIRAIEDFRADVGVLGLCALDHDSGITATSAHDAHVKRAILGSSRTVLAVSTADKVGLSATFRVSPADALDLLVTAEPDDAQRAVLAEADVAVVDSLAAAEPAAGRG